MNLSQQEIIQLFELKKIPCDSARVDFPLQGECIDIELQSSEGYIKFQADINRANRIVNKTTLQLRYKKTIQIRRLDFNGNHVNPTAPVPHEIFAGFEEHTFRREDHVHFYVDGYGDKWALPLSKLPEMNIVSSDDIYEKMIKFFSYCNVDNLTVKVGRTLLL